MKENLGLLASDLATISSKAEPFLATYSAVLSAISIENIYDMLKDKKVLLISGGGIITSTSLVLGGFKSV